MRIAREIICGLDYFQVISCAGMNMRQAAKKLGVGEDHFRRRMKALGMGHYFPLSRPRSRCISREDIIQVASEGYTQYDAAHILGVDYSYLKELVSKWELREYFIPTGEAISKGMKGYCS